MSTSQTFIRRLFRKGISWRVFVVLAVLLVAGSVAFQSARAPEAQAAGSSPIAFKGYAWSSNIGWISFSSLNCDADGDNKADSGAPAGCPTPGTAIPTYGVTDTGGTLSGYAWANPQDQAAGSNNIGWISFNSSDLTGCPSGVCVAKVDTTTGAVTGWARALSASGGWDGWISLSGVATDGSTYGVTDNGGVLSGWAWGGDVVGWISFNSSNPNAGGGPPYCVSSTGSCGVLPTATLSLSSPPSVTSSKNIPSGSSATLYWSSTNATACTATGGWSGPELTAGSQTITNITSDQTFTLTCTGPGGTSAPTSVTVNVSATSCLLPWGGTISNGSFVTAYSVPSVTAPATCSPPSIKQTRTCTNGVLSGTYQNQSCTVIIPPPPTITSGTLTAIPIMVPRGTAINATFNWSLSGVTSLTSSDACTIQQQEGSTISTIGTTLTGTSASVSIPITGSITTPITLNHQALYNIECGHGHSSVTIPGANTLINLIPQYSGF
ncbi:MAG: hypothetical protein B7X04_04215 [Parcubacteria group bacterium 21-54-25]|nr:MAG: hypothetical protein B7X04_04215 [Parcubacteria group bacterium 21-54-25]HQU08130.1 hypothetical protein [Candidatus Paceibacterota bacterium]